MIDWLGALIRATDATLLDEWSLLAGKPLHEHLVPDAPDVAPAGPPAAWRTAVRTAAFGWVELLAARAHAALSERSGWDEHQLALAMQPYWAEYDAIEIDADARAANAFSLVDEPGRWVVTQRLSDPAGDGEWRFVATVDLALAADEGAPTLHLEQLGRFG